jgi:hypothetical protein
MALVSSCMSANRAHLLQKCYGKDVNVRTIAVLIEILQKVSRAWPPKVLTLRRRKSA